MENMEQGQMPQGQPQEGRGTDTQMAHVSLGEIVIPRALQDGPNFAAIQQLFAQAGIDINEFTVGHEANKINPETGYPEFGFFKKLRKIAGYAAPLAGLIPGIGLPLAIGLGAGAGALSGNGLRGILSGGLGAAALGGGGGVLGNALGIAGKTAASTVGTGLLGAGAGAASGGLKGAAIGGAAGGIGGYANAGGFSGIGDSLGVTGPGSILGETAGTPLAGGIGPTEGSGISGAVTRLAGSGSGLTNTGTSAGAGMSSYGNIAGNIFSGISSTKANDDAEKALLAAQGKSLDAIQPYLNAKFEPGDLTQDPGYQFRLQQGQAALDRSLASKGGLFSGRAAQEAQNYGQGLADSTYNDAYQRWLAQNGQNIGAAGMAAGIFDNTGNIQAKAGINNSNVLNRTLSGLFGNGSFDNTGASTGGISPELLALLRSKSASAYGY